MKKYEVAIRATVTQSFVVEAPDEYEAKLYAHEAFDIAQPQSFEQYSEEVLWLTEVKDG